MNKYEKARRKLEFKIILRARSVGLYAVILFFRLNGLFSCIADLSSRRTTIPSRLWIFYHVLLISIMVYMNFCIGIPKLVYEAGILDSELAEILEIIAIGVASAIVIVIWILFATSWNEGTIFIEKLVTADCVVKKFHEKYHLKSFDATSLLVALVYFLLWIPLIGTEWVTYGEPIEWYLWFSLYCSPSFVITMFIMQYALTVKLLRQRFMALNDTICRHVEVTKRSGFTDTQICINHTVKSDFVTWRMAHNELYEATIMLAKFYSFPILLVFAYTHYGILFNCFYVLKSSEYDHLWGAEWTIANGLLWGIILVIPTAVLMIQIDLFNTEAKRKSKICRMLLFCFSSNREFRKEVKLYSQELLHEDFNFTAFGFFPLNGTLLRSVFATTVTYLVILYQFRGTDDNKNVE